MITLREKKGEGRLLHILMGRARTGKSERVLQRIAALGDSSQQILLVPEHASHVAEMDLCRVCGDTASRHAEALTFKLLASRVLSICGGSADVTLDSGGKLLTLQRTLTELAPVLKVYKRPSQRAAFLESLLAVMEELQAYAVSPEQLSESVAQIEGESGDKLRDLSLIYGIYLSKLHAPGHDARDVLEKLEENLEASGYIDNKDIFLDGFSYFTGRELRILRILLRRAKSVTVTLLGDTQDRELFSESLRVRERLYALARDAGVACEEKILPQGEVRGALDHIERCFFGAADEFTQPTDTVALYEAGSAYSECEWVASQVLQLVRKQGYRYREITVTARDLDSYAGAQLCANRPPLTPDRRLRMVFISTISAPLASSWPVICCSSAPGISGFSNSALPPPDSRNSTVSSAVKPCTSSSAFRVAAKPFSSGTGCPASQQSTPGIVPFTWPYLVTTTPPSTRPRNFTAAWAICHAALPAATSSTLPPCGRKFFNARRTASSGRTAFRLARMMASASLRSVSFFSMSFSPFPSLLVRGQKTPVQSLPMQENAVQVF